MSRPIILMSLMFMCLVDSVVAQSALSQIPSVKIVSRSLAIGPCQIDKRKIAEWVLTALRGSRLNVTEASVAPTLDLKPELVIDVDATGFPAKGIAVCAYSIRMYVDVTARAIHNNVPVTGVGWELEYLGISVPESVELEAVRQVQSMALKFLVKWYEANSK